MFLDSIVFNILTILSSISAFIVITAPNPVYSVLFLILVFCCNTGILLILGTEFLALIFLIVYVGAIAVLFLFVVMMLNIKSKKVSISYYTEIITIILPVIIFILIVLSIKIGHIYTLTKPSDIIIDFNNLNIPTMLDFLGDIRLLGQLIYTYYVVYFIMAGIILLEAMIGAIILTSDKHKDIKRQHVFQQISRDFVNAVFLTEISSKKQ